MDLLKIYRDLDYYDDNFLILGSLSDELTIPLIDFNTSRKDGSKSFEKKLSFITAECFQNIVRHGHSDSESQIKIKNGMFGFSKKADETLMRTTNLVRTEKGIQLNEKLSAISSLPKDKLKEVYLQVLSEGKQTEGGGAGLGLIEMIRKTGGNVRHEFAPMNDSTSYFHFDVSLLPKINDGGEETATLIAPKTSTKQVHSFMSDNNILLVIKTNFNHQTFLHLTKILESKLAVVGTKVNYTNLCFIFVEMIQNIYKHGLSSHENGTEGIFILQEIENGYRFNSGNFVTNRDQIKILDHIEKLNNATPNELDEMYKNLMLSGNSFEENSPGGIGLLEIRRMTQFPITVEITKIDGEQSFINISTLIQ